MFTIAALSEIMTMIYIDFKTLSVNETKLLTFANGCINIIKKFSIRVTGIQVGGLTCIDY